MAVECVLIVRVKLGDGGVCKVLEAAPRVCMVAGAKNGSCNGDQICKKCWTSRIPQQSIRKALQRLAATQVKVTAMAMAEKKARVIADVQAAIAERTRKREKDVSEKQGQEPNVETRIKNDEAAMTNTDVQDDIREQKRRREQEGEPKEKHSKDEMRQAQDKNTACDLLQSRTAPRPATKPACRQTEAKQRKRRRISNICVLLALRQSAAPFAQAKSIIGGHVGTSSE